MFLSYCANCFLSNKSLSPIPLTKEETLPFFDEEPLFLSLFELLALVQPTPFAPTPKPEFFFAKSSSSSLLEELLLGEFKVLLPLEDWSPPISFAAP